MSGELLPSIWVITTSCGNPPAAYGVPASNVPSPLLRYTRIVPGEPLTAATTSSLPSPFTSPAATALRFDGAGGVLRGGWSVPSPLPSRAEMMFVELLAVTRSGLPSPSTSAAADHHGALAGYGCAGWK